MGGQTDRQTDGWTDRQTDRQTDGWTVQITNSSDNTRTFFKANSYWQARTHVSLYVCVPLNSACTVLQDVGGVRPQPFGKCNVGGVKCQRERTLVTSQGT